MAYKGTVNVLTGVFKVESVVMTVSADVDALDTLRSGISVSPADLEYVSPFGQRAVKEEDIPGEHNYDPWYKTFITYNLL